MIRTKSIVTTGLLVFLVVTWVLMGSMHAFAHGLIIGGDDTTIDGNGHAIDGGNPSSEVGCYCNDGWCDNVNRDHYRMGEVVTESCTFSDGPLPPSWSEVTVNDESPHPYPNNYDNTWTYTEPGAIKVKVHFSMFNTEEGYDFVYFCDGDDNLIAKWDGYKGACYSPEVDGDTIKVRLVTDYTVQEDGIIIDKFCYLKYPPPDPHLFRPRLICPVLHHEDYPDDLLGDNPNWVRAERFENLQDVKDYLVDMAGWSETDAEEAAGFVFNEEGCVSAIAYRYEWEENDQWDQYQDNHGNYRQSPDTETVVVGINEYNELQCGVTPPHSPIALEPNPWSADGKHWNLYFWDATHEPHINYGTDHDYFDWGDEYVFDDPHDPGPDPEIFPDLNDFKPHIYYTTLHHGDFPECLMLDNPNWVRPEIRWTKEGLENYLSAIDPDNWAPWARRVANYVFDEEESSYAVIYIFEWKSDETWNKFKDGCNFDCGYREGPDLEFVVLGITENDQVDVKCLAMLQGIFLKLQGDNLPIIAGTHPEIWIHAGFHCPDTDQYDMSGNSECYEHKDWGHSYVLDEYYPPDVPVLSVSLSSLDFGYLETTMTFDITNTGGGTLSWDITKDSDWISLSENHGDTTTETDTITVTVDRTELGEGNHHGTVNISSCGGNQDVDISVGVVRHFFNTVSWRVISWCDSPCSPPTWNEECVWSGGGHGIGGRWILIYEYEDEMSFSKLIRVNYVGPPDLWDDITQVRLAVTAGYKLIDDWCNVPCQEPPNFAVTVRYLGHNVDASSCEGRWEAVRSGNRLGTIFTRDGAVNGQTYYLNINKNLLSSSEPTYFSLISDLEVADEFYSSCPPPEPGDCCYCYCKATSWIRIHDIELECEVPLRGKWMRKHPRLRKYLPWSRYPYVRLAWRIYRASGRKAGSNKTPTVTGRKGHANKARAVSRNGASEGSMRQNPCT